MDKFESKLQPLNPNDKSENNIGEKFDMKGDENQCISFKDPKLIIPLKKINIKVHENILISILSFLPINQLLKN